MYVRAEIGFLEFFQKPPGGHTRPARRHKRQTHFLGTYGVVVMLLCLNVNFDEYR